MRILLAYEDKEKKKKKKKSLRIKWPFILLPQKVCCLRPKVIIL